MISDDPDLMCGKPPEIAPSSTVEQFQIIACCNCGIRFGLPFERYKRLRDDPEEWFYCPNGHRQHYSKPLFEVEMERRLAAEKLAEDLKEEKDHLERKWRGTKGAMARQKKRFEQNLNGAAAN